MYLFGFKIFGFNFPSLRDGCGFSFRRFWRHLSLSNDVSVEGVCKDVDSIFDSFSLFWRWRQTLTVHAVNCPFFGMSQARGTLSCSDCFAKFVQLVVAHFFDCAC